MSKIVMGHEIGQAVIDALGLPQTTKGFTLRCYAGEPVVVDCEYFVTRGEELAAALAQYLVRSRGEQQPSSAPAALDFDTWMRARTEAAHAAYMDRHADGGISYPLATPMSVTVNVQIEKLSSSLTSVAEAIGRSARNPNFGHV